MPLVQFAWNRALINRRYKLTSRTRAWKHHPVKQRQGIGKYLYRDILFSAKYCYIRKARNSIESWNSYVIRKGDIETGEIIHLVTNAQIHISLSHIDGKSLIAKLQCRVCQKKLLYPHVFTRLSAHLLRGPANWYSRYVSRKHFLDLYSIRDRFFDLLLLRKLSAKHEKAEPVEIENMWIYTRE